MPNKPSHRSIRRVVTGHDSQGRSIFIDDRASPFTLEMPNAPGLVVTDLWKTYRTPASNSDADEPCTADITLAPPPGGSVLRVVQFPPDAEYMDAWDVHSTFAAMGHDTTDTQVTHGRTAGMHRTRSLDYALVLSGEIWAVMDVGETLLRTGDVLIQRGSNHGWSNRTSQPALVAFVLIDAEPLTGPNR